MNGFSQTLYVCNNSLDPSRPDYEGLADINEFEDGDTVAVYTLSRVANVRSKTEKFLENT